MDFALRTWKLSKKHTTVDCKAICYWRVEKQTEYEKEHLTTQLQDFWMSATGGKDWGNIDKFKELIKKTLSDEPGKFKRQVSMYNWVKWLCVCVCPVPWKQSVYALYYTIYYHYYN